MLDHQMNHIKNCNEILILLDDVRKLKINYIKVRILNNH